MIIDKNNIKNYPPNYVFDLELASYRTRIIGIDEAGRGSLAGPVVIAGVIIDYLEPISGITDSKAISAKKREQLYNIILNNSEYVFHIAIIQVEDIEKLNIVNATKKGMMQCLEALYNYYDIGIIDAVKLKIKDKNIFSINKADLKSAAVGAASILAKVKRDSIMVELSKKYKGYDLEKNKGYPTKFHRDALHQLGISPIHRKTFSPVKEIFNKNCQKDLL